MEGWGATQEPFSLPLSWTTDFVTDTLPLFIHFHLSSSCGGKQQRSHERVVTGQAHEPHQSSGPFYRFFRGSAIGNLSSHQQILLLYKTMTRQHETQSMCESLLSGWLHFCLGHENEGLVNSIWPWSLGKNWRWGISSLMRLGKRLRALILGQFRQGAGGKQRARHCIIVFLLWIVNIALSLNKRRVFCVCRLSQRCCRRTEDGDGVWRSVTGRPGSGVCFSTPW